RRSVDRLLRHERATVALPTRRSSDLGVSAKIRDFVIPFCATAHLMGSTITITSCVTAVLMMNGMPYAFTTMVPFIMTLGIAMVAAPGAPGGAIMAALPFLFMVGLDPSGSAATLLVSLYIAQDSFGTATNISGDNAIVLIVDKWFSKTIEDKTVDTAKKENVL